MVPLVLIRHGQSVWNSQNKFTGWVDIDLSDKGKKEAITAGKLIINENLKFDYYFSSFQKRAINTLKLIQETIGIKNLKSQPQLTGDFLYLSSNHLYTFLILSFIAILSYSNNSKKLNYIFLYLLFISIILELAHLIIPNRSFQFEDLIGNITGVIVSYILIKFYEFIRR